MNIDLEQLKSIIINACIIEILPRFNRVKRNYKTDGSIVTEADIAMQNRLADALQKAYPEIALLGEEMSSEQQKLLLNSKQALWCLDPIDGTSNFAAGLPFFAVSLALIEDGEVTLGLVYDPIRNECFSARRGQGASLNNQILLAETTKSPLNKAIAFIDFKRLTPDLATRLVSEIPYASQRSMGSIALELCWIAAGRGHIYLHAKQQLWDYAAAQLILDEAGGHACTLEGDALKTNQLLPCSTVASLDKELFDDWCEYLNV